MRTWILIATMAASIAASAKETLTVGEGRKRQVVEFELLPDGRIQSSLGIVPMPPKAHPKDLFKIGDTLFFTYIDTGSGRRRSGLGTIDLAPLRIGQTPNARALDDTVNTLCAMGGTAVASCGVILAQIDPAFLTFTALGSTGLAYGLAKLLRRESPLLKPKAATREFKTLENYPELRVHQRVANERGLILDIVFSYRSEGTTRYIRLRELLLEIKRNEKCELGLIPFSA